MFSAGFSWWSCDCLICVAGLIAHVWGTALPGWTVLQVSWVFKSRSFHFLVVSKSLTEHKSWGEMMQRVTFTFHFRYSFCFLKISLIHFACFIYLLVYFKSGFPQWHSISSSTSHKPQNRPSGFVSFTSRWNLNKHLMDFFEASCQCKWFYFSHMPPSFSAWHQSLNKCLPKHSAFPWKPFFFFLFKQK